MSPRHLNVLFLCTVNAARSILAEAIVNRLGGDRLSARSAGSHPVGGINPGAVRLLEEKGYDVGAFSSKPWEVFAASDAPRFDVVITVCDEAAGEQCPLWPGRPLTAHWGLPDPAKVTAPEDAVTQAFAETYQALNARIRQLLELPLDTMSREDAMKALAAIGTNQGSVKVS